MKLDPRHLLNGALAILALGLGETRLLAAEPAIDPGADRLFLAASKYLSAAKGFTVKAEVWKDVVLPSGQKIQTTRTLDLQMLRPDQLHLEVRSPRTNIGYWYQGKSLAVLDRTLNLYGVMEVPGTFDEALDAVEDRFGIVLPLGDVLVSDPYTSLMETAESVTDLGQVTVLGVNCNHLAFTGPNADCQVWIATGAKPLPRKIVINFKTKTGSPQVTELFSDWDLTSPISESVFAFVPPEGAGKIVVNPGKPDDDEDEAPASAPATPAPTKQ